jgi:hypothetical protein
LWVTFFCIEPSIFGAPICYSYPSLADCWIQQLLRTSSSGCFCAPKKCTPDAVLSIVNFSPYPVVHSGRWQWWTGIGLDSVVSELFTFFAPLAQFSTSLHILPISISYIYNLYLYNIHILSRYHIYGCKMAEVNPLHKTFYVMVLWGYSLAIKISISGWWFGTCFIFPYIGNNHPNWLIFFRGVETTNQIWSNGISRGLVGYNMIQLYIYIYPT